MKKTVFPWYEYAIVLAIIIISTAGCYLIQDFVGYRVLSFVLLIVVSVLAFIYGTGPVLCASTLSALIWNFFFIPPHYTLHIEKTEDLLMFFMFFIIALLNGVLTSQIKQRENVIRLREVRTHILYELTKNISEENDTEKLKKMIEESIYDHFRLDAVIFLQNDILQIIEEKRNGACQVQKLSSEEIHGMIECYNHAERGGRFFNFFPNFTCSFYPLIASHTKTGMLVLIRPEKFSNEEMQFWETYLNQISGKFERERLNEMAKKAYMLDQSDKLYKTLFNSISHELRIPVTTIMGATDTLMSEQYSDEIKQELIKEINIASIRLNHLIENLLNISRLESGHFTLRSNWYDFHDLINRVLDSLQQELSNYNLNINIPDDLPLVKIDYGLIEQVMYNLLLNITQYVPQHTDITLDVNIERTNMKIKLTDQGAGFRIDDIGYVFDKFFRGKYVKTGGTGLGLSIVKGFVEAHKGEVIVYNAPTKGAVFEIKMPVEVSLLDIGNKD